MSASMETDACFQGPFQDAEFQCPSSRRLVFCPNVSNISCPSEQSQPTLKSHIHFLERGWEFLSQYSFLWLNNVFHKLHGASENFFEEEMIEDRFWIDTPLWLVFLFQSQTLNFTEDAVSWGCLAILQDVTKTGQEDLDRELLDHWLRDPGNNTATDTCTGFKSLTAAVVSVLWKQA